MFELEHLRSFVTLAAELNYRKAAYRLNITQPPLSRRIQALEAIVAADLFERGRGGVVLTAVGRAFLPEAHAILERSAAALRLARGHAADDEAGPLVVGFVGAATYSFLPRFVDRIRRDLPLAALTLRELESGAQLAELTAGRLDLGLIRPGAPADGIRTACVSSERLCAAVPIRHPLAGRRRLTLADLHGQPFIAYSAEGRYIRDKVRAALKAAQVRPAVVQELAHAQAILALVSVGLGLAIVPEETRAACFDNVVFRPVDLGSYSVAELHIAWKPGAPTAISERVLGLFAAA